MDKQTKELLKLDMELLDYCRREIGDYRQSIDRVDDDDNPKYPTYKLVDAQNLISEFLDDMTRKLKEEES